jgi:hypothetical protein
MIGGLATASQVRDGGIRLKQKLWGMERTKKIFNQAISPKTMGPDIHDFWKSCIHTSYVMSTLCVYDFMNEYSDHNGRRYLNICP